MATSGSAFNNGERPVRSDRHLRANVMPWVTATARGDNLKYQAGALQPRNRATDRIAIAACASYIHILHICACDGSHATGDQANLQRGSRRAFYSDGVTRAARHPCGKGEG